MEKQTITIFEIYRELCQETVSIWYDASKRDLLCWADAIDNTTRLIEEHAMNDTLPNESEWEKFLEKLEFYSDIDYQLILTYEKAKMLSQHPEYFDAALNAKQRTDYFR